MYICGHDGTLIFACSIASGPFSSPRVCIRISLRNIILTLKGTGAVVYSHVRLIANSYALLLSSSDESMIKTTMNISIREPYLI